MQRCLVRRTDIFLCSVSVLIIFFGIVPTLGFAGGGHSTNARILPFAKESSQSFCAGRIRSTSTKGGNRGTRLSLSQKSSASGKKSLDSGSIDARIREAEEQDLKAISSILTYEFFGKFNPLEWLQTYFSLQDSFPEAQ
uniref:Uncharacterized protein n=1 Tax=Chaetoceros debilis TaxID=122233 RepID=A0A7S3QGL8_9STRA